MGAIGSVKPWSMAALFGERTGGYGESDETLGVSRGTQSVGVGIQKSERQAWDKEGARAIVRVLRKYHPALVSETTLRKETGVDSRSLTRLLNALSIRCTLYEESISRGKYGKNYFGLLDAEKTVRDIDDDGN